MDVNLDKYREDARGALVPIDMIREIDLLRDDLVMEIVARSRELNVVLTAFKKKVMDDIAAFIELSAQKYEIKIGGEKGNVQLLSFNGKYRVCRSINDYIVFDERLQVAKKLVDECVSEWSKDSSSEIKVLVNHAFEVDKAGKINTERILGLRRLDIKDEKWKRAMDAIGDSVQVTGSKSYVRIYERNATGKYDQINLDMAAL